MKTYQSFSVEICHNFKARNILPKNFRPRNTQYSIKNFTNGCLKHFQRFISFNVLHALLVKKLLKYLFLWTFVVKTFLLQLWGNHVLSILAPRWCTYTYPSTISISNFHLQISVHMKPLTLIHCKPLFVHVKYI